MLSIPIDGEREKETRKQGTHWMIEGVNRGGKSDAQQRGTAFSAVILEVYEVCRNRISLYGRGRALAICSRADAMSTMKERALPETGCRIKFELF